MKWNTAKILFASTAAIAITSHVIKSVYKYFTKTSDAEKAKDQPDEACAKAKDYKRQEINDVLLFSDAIVRHSVKIPPNKNLTLCESREFNCYKLIKYIKSARETLDVCMYLITSNEIADQIIKLGQKHVLVRIVTDSDMAFTPPSQIKRLKEYSFIQVQANKKSILLHHKFCIIDGPEAIKRKNLLKKHAEKLNIYAKPYQSNRKSEPKLKTLKGFVMSGSLNWSTQAMVTNYESVIVTSHPNIVQKFEKEFKLLWKEDEQVSDLIRMFINLQSRAAALARD